MKLIRELALAKEEFFDVLLANLVEQLAATSDRKISVDQIEKGLSFVVHPQDENRRRTLTILDFEYPNVYSAEVRTVSDTILIHYTLEETSTGMRVTYEQRIRSFEEQKQNKFLRAFSEFMYLGRMSDHIYTIQTRAMNNREGLPTPNPAPLGTQSLKEIFRKK